MKYGNLAVFKKTIGVAIRSAPKSSDPAMT
jgi:hypothetical protein